MNLLNLGESPKHATREMLNVSSINKLNSQPT